VRTLYRARQVHTQAHPATGQWLLVDDRHIERVGVGDPPSADRVMELPGATIVPGFIDAHVHLTGTGLSNVGIPIERARSGSELLGFVAEELTHGPTKVFAHGFDETLWDRPDLPRLADFDDLGEVPVVLIRADGHIALVNSAALAASQAGAEEGVEQDAEGRPTGVVRRDANHRVQRWFREALTAHEIRELQLQAASLAASRGVTCIHQMAMPVSEGRHDLEVLLEHHAQLPLDVVTYVAEKDLAWLMDLGIETVGGDLSLDGSIGARTAALSAPYTDGDGTGVLYEEPDVLCEFFQTAHLAGMQVAVHAIGDAAIEQALTCWERVYGALDSRGRRHFRARRHRIEHFEMPSPPQIERAAILGLAISIQPAFDLAWGNGGAMYERRLGAERSEPMNPFQDMRMRGLVVGAGSDAPVTDLDPMLGMWALEAHHDVGQRFTRAQAFHMFTIGSATLAHLEDKKGALEPGMQADFAAYDQDPLGIDDPRGMRPILTVSRGREVFAR
jgi:predicted amidohydrolase YtcJ